MNHINAFFNLLLIIVNTIFCTIPLLIFNLLKSLLPIEPFRKIVNYIMLKISEMWISLNNFFFSLTHKVQWEIDGTKNLDRFKSYFIISNHKSWVDILVLQKALNRKVPFPRFFIKKQLQWLPLLGQAFKALDFPMMNRYSKEYLKKHPEKAGNDMAETQKACRKIAKNNVSLINFLEGTRFSKNKHKSQKSPFVHHLKPKAGGIAYALEAFEGKVNTVLDITIVYASSDVTLWSYLKGEVPKIIVKVKEIAIPKELLHGNYNSDPEYKMKMQNWVNSIWTEKDKQYAMLSQSI